MKFVLGMVVGMAAGVAGGYFGVKKLFENEEVESVTRKAIAELILGRKINWNAESASHHYDWTDYSKYVSDGVQEEWKTKEDTDEKFDVIDICGGQGLFSDKWGKLEEAFIDSGWTFYAGGGSTQTLSKDDTTLYIYHMSEREEETEDKEAVMVLKKNMCKDDKTYYGTVVMPWKTITEAEEEVRIRDYDWGFSCDWGSSDGSTISEFEERVKRNG